MDDGLDAIDGQCCFQIFQACVFSLTLFGLGKNNVALAFRLVEFQLEIFATQTSSLAAATCWNAVQGKIRRLLVPSLHMNPFYHILCGISNSYSCHQYTSLPFKLAPISRTISSVMTFSSMRHQIMTLASLFPPRP